LTRLAIHIGEVGELAQWPEALAHIADSSLDFTFFPARGWIAGARIETVFTGEAEEARLKTDEASVVFGDSGCKILCAAIRYVE
jgi:hypothetical protein